MTWIKFTVPPMLYVNGTAGQDKWNIGLPTVDYGLRTTGLRTPDRALFKD